MNCRTHRFVAALGVYACLMTATSLSAPAMEPERAGQQAFLSRAVFAQGRLWMLSDAGQLSSVAETEHARVEERLPEPAVDLCVSNGAPVLITVTGDAWTIRRRDGGTWIAQASIPGGGDTPIALECGTGDITLLTSHRLIDIGRGNEPRIVELSGVLGRGLVTSTYRTADALFVSINAGEWGGGLRRIDRRTGTIAMIERHANGNPCSGPLGASCDPVNGIAAEPGKPGCIVAAIGLEHFVSEGRLVEVCGEKVEQLYAKSNVSWLDRLRNDRRAKASSTVAFFGLGPHGHALLAVGSDGLYRIEGKSVQFESMPGFKDVGGIQVSFDVPGFVLLLTDINQRRSVSGSVPMLVPR